jgi:hypothetical protein
MHAKKGNSSMNDPRAQTGLPWNSQPGGRIFTANGYHVGTMHFGNDEAAIRAISCVNFCRGVDLSRVPFDSLADLERVRERLGEMYADLATQGWMTLAVLGAEARDGERPAQALARFNQMYGRGVREQAGALEP